MKLETNNFFLINAFTGKEAKGNQTAVVIVDDLKDEEQLLKISNDFNLSATTFLTIGEEKGNYSVRWFSPEQEIGLCGHGTVGASWLLLHHFNQGEKLVFKYSDGVITAEKKGNGVSVSFDAIHGKEIDVPKEVANGFGRKPNLFLKSENKHLVVYDDPEFIRQLKPSFDELRKVDIFGYVVTAPGIETDIVTRVFLPYVPFLEDPATGSAHVLAAPYWSEFLGKGEITSRQVSQRGGMMKCTYDKSADKVVLEASADLYAFGTLIDKSTT